MPLSSVSGWRQDLWTTLEADNIIQKCRPYSTYSPLEFRQSSFPGFEKAFQNVREDALNNISHLRNEVLCRPLLFSHSLSLCMPEEKEITRSQVWAIWRIVHLVQFWGCHSIPDCTGASHRRLVKKKHDSSLRRSPSLWIVPSRQNVSDFVRKVTRIHLRTLGQNIDEKLACSIENTDNIVFL
jgi:hypothetical protein